MRCLLLDIGNSKIKSCLSKDGKLTLRKSSAYDRNGFKQKFRSIIKSYSGKGATAVWISSLDKSRRSYITEVLSAIPGDPKINFINTKTKMPMKIDYANTLGSDRICSSYAAFIKYGKHKNILVFDFGTATTVNFIKNGIYKGGMITAGLMTSAGTLNARTTLPKAFFSQKASPENKTTKGAIASGLLLQQAYFAEMTAAAYRKEYGKVFAAATGGNLIHLKKHLISIQAFDDNLVLEGLNGIMAYNENIWK